MKKDINKRPSFLTVLLSGLRHRLLVYLRPRYVISSLLRRRGNCNSCGSCCLLNKPNCRYLKDNKCEIYKNQPFFCRVFPIDEKDKEMSGVKEICGYYWERE